MRATTFKWQAWFWPVLVAWMSLFALGLVDNARGPVFPDILHDFSLSDTRGSLFYLTASLASLIHNLIFYRFLCQTDPKRLVGLYTLIMAAGSLLISHATDFRWTLVACAILGVGFGGLGVGQNSAVQEAPREHRQRAMGLLHAMYGISSFSAPLFVSMLAGYGWRLSVALLSLPSVFVGLLVVFESARARLRRTKVEVRPKPAPLEIETTAPAVHRHARWCAALLVACVLVGEISISSRLTLLARREWGLSIEAAGHYLALYFIAMATSRLALGLFKVPISARKLLTTSLIVGLPLLVLALIPLGISTEARLLSLVIFGFPIAVGYPLAMTRIAEVFGRGSQAVTSLALVVQSFAAVMMHFTLGWGADSAGLVFILSVVSIASLLGALAASAGLERLSSR